MSKRKDERPTVGTDISRLICCGLGFLFIGISATGYFDEKRHWPLGAVIFFAVLGLLFVGIAVFAKPKTLNQ